MLAASRPAVVLLAATGAMFSPGRWLTVEVMSNGDRIDGAGVCIGPKIGGATGYIGGLVVRC